ncbi:endonuclease/exonuclease/phosphatase family protein [Rubinisphaera margarita]|uniref:endonuclease/exonuclease/phosphatase family protein n=1 Tax=Rubinisphaera margarita TaxID=2909586 RepID=UPI001EE7BDA1|nr:endonuclease/exonuclease/phosphatase family protein [Rubinisphaera margarita]MCG6157476.1 endonuclease/exonuclease/phosphatase family protein [Rubinisphaera margarita]
MFTSTLKQGTLSDMEDAPDHPVESAEPEATSRTQSPYFRWIAMLFILVAVGLEVVYLRRPDHLAVITVFPVWVWTISLSGIAMLFGLLLSRRYCMLIVLMIGVTLFLSDTPPALVRGLYRQAPPEVRSEEDGTLRFITLNCLDTPSALLDLARYRPDVIFVEESVGPSELEKTRLKIFGESGHLMKDRDLAIISRFELSNVPVSRELAGYCLAGRIHVDGHSILLVPLHLNASPFRFDLWNAACWRAYTANRRTQRSQMEVIFKSIPQFDQTDAVVIGGDFNAPPGDAIFKQMPHFMRDAFHEVGVGWGCTIANDFPLIRIDQLWSTPKMHPIRCKAVKSNGSDHRAVIVDYRLLHETH